MNYSDLVGKTFTAFGDTYICKDFDSNRGLLMEMTVREIGWLGRKIGDLVWVSERAISAKTYQQIEE